MNPDGYSGLDSRCSCHTCLLLIRIDELEVENAELLAEVRDLTEANNSFATRLNPIPDL